MYWDSLFKLVASGYTDPFERVFRRAGTLADWDADRWPLKEALDQVANESLDLQDRIRLAVRAFVDLLPRTVLPEKRQRIVIQIAERLSSGNGDPGIVQAVARELPGSLDRIPFMPLKHWIYWPPGSLGRRNALSGPRHPLSKCEPPESFCLVRQTSNYGR